MRTTILALPLLLTSTPLYAQAAPEAPRVIIPPAAADRAADTVQNLTDAILDMRIGRLKAALDGRSATESERHATVRDLANRKNPDFDRKLHQQFAQMRPVVQQSIVQLDAAIPEMVAGLEQVSRSLKRATANLPDPTYPNR